MACQSAAHDNVQEKLFLFLCELCQKFIISLTIRKREHATRNQPRMGSILSLSQIISNCIKYGLRLYPVLYVWLYCSLTLFWYIFCMPYIFLGWCSPSMWPLVLHLIQNWLFIARYFPFYTMPLNFLVLRLFWLTEKWLNCYSEHCMVQNTATHCLVTQDIVLGSLSLTVHFSVLQGISERLLRHLILLDFPYVKVPLHPR